jgi:predicted permease
MSLLDGLRYRLRVLLGPERYGRELDEEIEFHLSLDAMQRQHAAHGALSAAEARHAARRRFGNPTTHMEEARQMAGLGFLDVVRQDVRFALRSFRRTPAFTAVAVLTLAIGIGANTAIFSAVNALLLRPLPFPAPERLMSLGMTVPARGDQPARDNVVWSYPKFGTFRDAQRVFADLALYSDWQFTVRAGEGTERVTGELTGASYLRTLGLRPALGRDFGAAEDRPGAERVALIGDGYWQRRYNADPAVIGRALTVNGEPYTIVGVMPPGFRGLTGEAEIWLPLLSQSEDYYSEPWNHSYFLVARLAPGVTPERAEAETRRLGTVVDAAWPHPEIHDEHWGAAATPLDAHRVDPLVRRSVLVLLGAVGLVLLIACANVANLFLVRAAGRRREIAVRLAVGAGRGRLVRQLLTESLLLAVLGGLAGVLLAWWGVRLLAAFDPSTALRVQRMEGLGAVGFELVRLDPTALLFAALVTVGTGLLFGLVPALQATRPSLAGALKEERGPERPARGGAGGRNVLAVAEIALAVVLLAGSGLMLRSLGKLLGVSPGVNADHVLTLRFTTTGYGRDSLPGMYDQMLARLAALPGVTGAALGNCVPLSGGCNGTGLWRRDRPEPPPGEAPEIGIQWATPGWFRTLQVPLKRGRLFTEADRRDTRKVVLVSETAARRIWPGEDPLGKPVSVGQGFYPDTATVVGVVGDVRFGSIDSLPNSEVYLSYYQAPSSRMVIYLRTSGDPLALVGPARAALRELAPDVPVYDVRTLEDRLADATAYARFSALLLALFAGVALALAAIGVYGVISFGVSQRTREIGVRVALGASRADVTRLVVGQGLGLALAGAALGVAAALAATRVLRSLLAGVAPGDPATFAAIVALLVAAVLVASWLPARRAARVQPAEVLREA